MKNDDVTPPLDTPGSDTPQALLDVMHALGREGPSRVSLERVARGLGPLLDARPPALSPAAQEGVRAVVRVGWKWIAARVVAGMLAVGGAAYWLQHEPPAPVASPAPAQPAIASSAVEDVEAPVASVQEPPVQVAVQPGPSPKRSTEHTSRRSRHTHARSAELAPSQPVVVAQPEPVAPAAAAEVETPRVAAREPVERDEPAPSQAAKGPDEFSLLVEARKAMKRDPNAALAALQLHAQRFANGQLAPEREVLAVEVLRRLGRRSEADARLQAFREKYPDSIHLRRLEH